MVNVGSRRRLQVCGANLLARRPDLLQQLREQGIAVELVECLDLCTRCENGAFALVGGRFAYASTPEEFCERLRKE